jgi:hypothetical protein
LHWIRLFNTVHYNEIENISLGPIFWPGTDTVEIQTGHLAVEAWIFAQPLGLTAISILFLFNNLVLSFNFGKMNPWPVEDFFDHICHHFWLGLLLHLLHSPKSDDKYAQKELNWSEVHLSDVTSYKIYTLVSSHSLMAFIDFLFLHIYSSSESQSKERCPCLLM